MTKALALCFVQKVRKIFGARQNACKHFSGKLLESFFVVELSPNHIFVSFQCLTIYGISPGIIFCLESV
jgi:hypothetical protein